ncbi:MAG: TatD family hydrolase [Candidatus Omnitrophica bacterium]|nr:TatD family hydrolase [Candidatus Omnitrophota bacterium]
MGVRVGMLIDTHCHLHFDAFDADREAVIARAREFGVRYMVCVGTDPVTNEQAYRLSRAHDFIFHTAGLHPHHSHEVPMEGIRKFVGETKPRAIGEIGLDYFKSEADPAAQKKAFAGMLRLALERDLPVIVHSRNAFEDTLALLRSEGGGRLRAVMHCFSYDAGALKKLLDSGFLVSFTCNLTFKNAGSLLDVAASAPLDRLMLETDSPYLAPQVYRGRRNEPACLVHLSEFLAKKKGIGEETLRKATSENAVRFFGLPASGG